MILLLVTASIALAPAAQARECIQTASRCIEGPETRNVNGVQVYRECWKYQDSYDCLAPGTTDYCAPLAQLGTCTETNSTCSATAFTGECISYTKTYRCTNKVDPPPVGVITLDTTYTITTDTIDRSACASPESNPSCNLANKVCVEPGGTRNINGLDVTKDCWKWEESYTCIAQDYKDYCLPVRQTSGCIEVGQKCTKLAWNGTCNEYERSFRCDAKLADPLPDKVTFLESQYTIVKDVLKAEQCDPLKTNPNCNLASHVCTQPGGTRKINGLDVYKDCWEWTDEYVCAGGEYQNDCGKLQANPACTQTSQRCISVLPDGKCGLVEHKFQCKVKEGETKEVTTCDTGVCVNGDCNTPSTNPDQDFGAAATSMEAARQIGTYFDPATFQFFKGIQSSCSHKLGNVLNCCKADVKGGAAQSNSSMFMAAKVFGTVGGEAVRFAGSSYVYDALFSNDLVPTSVINALYGNSSGNSYSLFGNGNLSFYGVTFVPGGTPPFAFDPYSFAIAIAMQVLTEYLSCDQDEQVLAMRRGQNLCSFVGSYCSERVLGVCLTKKESYCCFNSRLARIINEQGREQIGKGYGNPEAPDCSGFTTDDLAKLDFGKMDLSEFLRDIGPKDLNTLLAQLRGTDTVQKCAKDYFGGGCK